MKQSPPAPLVSIIIPLYNKEQYISKTLSSVMAQTNPDWECVVVDDGSTDQSPQRVRAIEDARIKLLSQANAGPGAARNYGAQQARGEWLLFLDADDELAADNLAQGRHYLEGQPVNVFLYAHQLQGEHQPRCPLPPNQPTHTLLLNPHQHQMPPKDWAYYLNSFAAGSAWLRRGCFGRYPGFYDQGKITYGEDSYHWLPIILEEKALIVPRYCGVQIQVESSQLGIRRSSPKVDVPLVRDRQSLYPYVSTNQRPILEQIIDRYAYRLYNQWMLHGAYRKALQIRRERPNLDNWAPRKLWPGALDTLRMRFYNLLKASKRQARHWLGAPTKSKA